MHCSIRQSTIPIISFLLFDFAHSLTCPPGSEAASNITTSCPLSHAILADSRPPGPAPTITILFLVFEGEIIFGNFNSLPVAAL